ncbi:MAG: ribosomal protein S18-alanine N-acetyltransferase [Rickettsiales bacterium]|nr:ribosomal protein S18-alanine N-acetyltransferase [Rickettsiales bacterium]
MHSNINLKKLTNLYLSCFPERNENYAASYFSTLDQYTTFTEEDGDNLTGFLIFRNLGRETEVIDLGVHPDFRKLGIAQKLLARLEEYSKKANSKEIQLEVRDDNVPAINLYRKLGFIKVGIRENYYQTNGVVKDGILMSKMI